MTFKCGEKPGIGHYRCGRCGQIIYLDQNSDRLPPCPKCNACSWNRS